MKTLIIIFLLFQTVFAQNFKSPENKVNLIELYTSEGCSSCPSADKWLNNLENNKNLFKTFIPLAFHVTYWDFLGWKDSFGKKAFDKRQRNYSSNVWKKNSVYTPQFVINSKEYKQWFSNKKFPKITNEYAGILEADLENNKIKVLYSNKNKNMNSIINVNILILENNLKVFVKKGENKNKTLVHNFVVKDFYNYKSEIKNGEFKDSYTFNIKNKKNKILVVFISSESNQQIQALGSYL
ncbi:MAG: DUF1223 domain-containing protein [Campylobacteraceae bacterium]|nr:DUF1223 domain-containing protein [Campylobacteraceae bacterium]